LEKEIVPTLYNGLTAMCKKMPEDPYTWLAYWLMEHNPNKTQGAVQFEEQVVANLKQGDYFGEIALLTNKPRQVTVKADGYVRVLGLDRDSFNRLCGSLFDVLSRNMGTYEEMMASMADAKAKQDVEAADAAKKEAIKIDADLKQDEEDNAKDKESLAPLPSGPRKKQKATKRHRNSVFTASVTQDESWQPPLIDKSEAQRDRISELIAKGTFLSKLDAEQTTMVLNAFEPCTKSKGQSIIVQGEDGDYFYMLDTGSADVFVAKDGGEPKQVTTYQPGNTFGELALLHGDKRAATVTATSDCTLWRLDRDTFKRIMMSTTYKQQSQKETFLENVPVLTSLTKYERFRIADSMKTLEFEDGQVIIKEGDAGNEFYIIEKGSVACTKRMPIKP